MKLIRSKKLNAALLFAAPAAGVILIIIFFLLLSTSFLMQSGVAVRVPHSPFLLSPQSDPQVVSVTAAPQSAIYFNNREVDADELRKEVQEARGSRRTIIIKADRRASFEKIATVMTVSLELGLPTVLATTEEAP